MITPPPITEGRLLDRLLMEQGQLTAVERFAQLLRQPGAVPDQARYYRDLIPLAAPRPGEQYAFAVDLDSCTGCKACVSACHSLNGLDDSETWRGTGILQGGTFAEPYQQVVTSACHHCLDPACLNGCPVLAYEKDPLTGIVRHLDDQCIGCQYCILKCPYDVPQYSSKRGIVRKCDMCHSRLAAQEAPACVQACPSHAITIRVVSKADARNTITSARTELLPGTAPSSYTQPTTVYNSRRPLPANTQAGDAQVLRSEPAHWPLVWMLVLTQFAAGLTCLTLLAAVLMPKVIERSGTITAAAACFLLHIGLVASVTHLGKPAGAWRAFLGWRRSWMSREILAFGGFSIISGLLVLTDKTQLARPAFAITAGLASVVAVVAVFCSAMIYIDTRRALWRARNTFPDFFGTMLVLGASGGAALYARAAWSSPSDLGPAARACCLLAITLRNVMMVAEGYRFLFALRNPSYGDHRSTRVAWAHHRDAVIGRIAFDVLAVVFGVLALNTSGHWAVVCAAALLTASFLSALLGRYLFFVTVVAPRMPGTAS